MGARSRIGWALHGRDRTLSTFDSLSVDLRALQERVDRVEAAVQARFAALDASATPDQRELESALDAVRDRQLEEFDGLREQVIATTDDLSARIAALHDRLGSDR